MKKFIRVISLYSIPWICFLLIIIIIGESTNYFYDLEYYQNKKIHLIDKNSTIFFGDSSCGNGINANLFGENTFNLSLTGNYITCGGLSQLRKLISSKQIPKRVFFMYTIDGYSRNSSTGYKIDNNSYKDHFQLKIRWFKDLIKHFVFKNNTPRLVIDNQNDFIKQNEKSIEYDPTEIEIKLSSDNKNCIIEIFKLCEKYEIEYTFMIGPNINGINKNSLMKFNDFFKMNNINLITDYFLITSKEVGDSKDHIKPIFKSKSTEFYKNILIQK